MVDATKLMNELASMLERQLRKDPALRVATVVRFIRAITDDCAAGVFDDSEYYSADLPYDEQLRLCREHNMLCLEFYRRNGVPKRQRVKSCLVKGGEASDQAQEFPRHKQPQVSQSV